MDVYACGSNTLGQLRTRRRPWPEAENIDSFEKLELSVDTDNVEILFAGFAQTVVLVNKRDIFAFGHGSFQYRCEDGAMIREAFGDHDGVMGLLDASGNLYIIKPRQEGNSQAQTIAQHSGSPQVAPKFLHIAIDGAGHTAALVHPTNDPVTLQMLDFDSTGSTPDSVADQTATPPPRTLLAYNLDPNLNKLKAQHTLPHSTARPTALAANNATFTFLDAHQHVRTWTRDARWSSHLGRAANATSPATTPAIVDAVEALGVRKVAAGGWMTAALTEAGECYVWGQAPGAYGEEVLRLEDVGEMFDEGGGVYRVVLEGDEPGDIVDVAVGGAHVLVLLASGQMWAAGRNSHGQLGLAVSDQDTVKTWRRVPFKKSVLSISAGENGSFAVVARSGAEDAKRTR